MLASASAAALATLAITVAVPALADDPAGAKGPDDLAACLRDNGLAGAPDGDDLKPWLGPRLERRDAAAQKAMEKCAPPKPVLIQRDGPDAKELRTCLTGHGVSLPAGDDRVLKRWVMEHGDDAANRAAHEGLPHAAAPQARRRRPVRRRAPRRGGVPRQRRRGQARVRQAPRVPEPPRQLDDPQARRAAPPPGL